MAIEFSTAVREAQLKAMTDRQEKLLGPGLWIDGAGVLRADPMLANGVIRTDITTPKHPWEITSDKIAASPGGICTNKIAVGTIQSNQRVVTRKAKPSWSLYFEYGNGGCCSMRDEDPTVLMARARDFILRADMTEQERTELLRQMYGAGHFDPGGVASANSTPVAQPEPEPSKVRIPVVDDPKSWTYKPKFPV